MNNAPQAIRRALLWMLEPDRLLPGSVLVLVAALMAMLTIRTPRTSMERFPLPENTRLAIHASSLETHEWEAALAAFLPPDSLDPFALPLASGREAEIIILDRGADPFAVLLIPEGNEAALELMIAASLAPHYPEIREVRLPDGTRFQELTIDPSQFPFATTTVNGIRARALKHPKSSASYLSTKNVTIIANSQENLAAALKKSSRQFTRLCDRSQGITVSFPRNTQLTTSPSFLSPPFPRLFLPQLFFTIKTPGATITLPVCGG